MIAGALAPSFSILFGEEVQSVAKCDICGKGVTFGIKVSHSHRRSNRTWKPNVKRVKAIVDGSPRHVYVISSEMKLNREATNRCFTVPCF